jgi:hypothetical protein
MAQSVNQTAFALNSVAAAGADAVLDAGVLTFTGGFSFIYDDILTDSVNVQATVAGVGRVQTATCSAPVAVGEEYYITIQQYQASGGVFEETIFISSVVGDTATTIATKMTAAINGYITSGQLLGTATSAAAVITTTGAVASPMLRLVNSSPNIALAVTTAGTPPVNTAAQLATLNATNFVSTNTYTVLQFQHAHDLNTINGDKGVSTFYYLINAGDADAAALVTKINEIFAGIIPGGTAANPEAIAKN